MDARSNGGGQVGSRTVTLASDYAGTSGLGQVRTLQGLMRRLAGQCQALTGTLGACLVEHAPTLDFFGVERVMALRTVTGSVTANAQTLIADIDDILGRATDPTASPGAAPVPGVSAAASNRVVYAEELEPMRGDLRQYRFSVTSSPIELGQDLTWQTFLATFARTYYVSATLRVGKRWTSSAPGSASAQLSRPWS